MADRPLRFGISASHGGAHLLDGANQFIEALSAALGRPVKLWVSADYDHLVRAIAESTVDLAWMPPLLQTRVNAPLLAVAVRDGELSYRSAILVRNDSPAQKPSDLTSVRAAWNDRSSSSGYIFPRLHLAAAGASFAQEEFVGSFMRSCAAVAEGSADVCACFVREGALRSGKVMEDLLDDFGWIAHRLRVLDVTDPIPPDGIVMAPKFDRPAQQATTRALVSLHEGESGRAAIAMLLSAERLVAPTGDLAEMMARLRERAAQVG